MSEQREFIAFAHRGAPILRRDENTLHSFARALRLGANGLESDVALTADGVPVLVHRGPLAPRATDPARLQRSELPPQMPSLEALYTHCGTDYHLALDMFVPGAADTVVDVARRHDALDRLWLTYWRIEALAAWRERWTEVRTVYPTVNLLPGRTEMLARRLREAGVDALNLYHPLARGRIIPVARQNGLRVFAWGARSRRALRRLVRIDIDGVFGDDADALAELVRAKPPTSSY